jgi:hypothetical protein
VGFKPPQDTVIWSANCPKIHLQLPRELRESFENICRENQRVLGDLSSPKPPLCFSDGGINRSLCRNKPTLDVRHGGISPWTRVYGSPTTAGRSRPRPCPRQVKLKRRSNSQRGSQPTRTDYMAYYSPAAVKARRERPPSKKTSSRTVTMGRTPTINLAPTGWSGPRVWLSGESEQAPGAPARIRVDDAPPPARELSGAAPSPELNFTLQRETFGIKSISEKFALLSLPRSRRSSAKLQKRCFSMHVVRNAIARSLDARNRHERYAPYERTFNLDLSSPSSGSSPEPELVSRPQWMRDAQPDLSDEEADAIWIA